MKNEFEKKLKEMTKPSIPDLKHEDMLANAIVNAKDKSIVSLWWLSVPVFIILMLLMKSFYMPGSSLISNLRELTATQKNLSVFFFLISPLLLIIFNVSSIRRVHFLSGSPKSLNFLEAVWFNILIILVSVLIIVIYSL